MEKQCANIKVVNFKPLRMHLKNASREMLTRIEMLFGIELLQENIYKLQLFAYKVISVFKLKCNNFTSYIFVCV